MTAIASVSIGLDESVHYGGSCTSDYGFAAAALAAALEVFLMCGMMCTMRSSITTTAATHQYGGAVGGDINNEATPAGLQADQAPATMI
jgi:hypothetical protein